MIATFCVVIGFVLGFATCVAHYGRRMEELQNELKVMKGE